MYSLRELADIDIELKSHTYYLLHPVLFFSKRVLIDFSGRVHCEDHVSLRRIKMWLEMNKIK